MEIPLLDLHQKVTLKALLCQHDVSHKDREIVRILGGINVILSHYISSSDDLDDGRIGEIIAVIRDESDDKMTNKKEDDNDHQISLNPNDSILQKIFPGPFADRMCAMIRHKILVFVMTSIVFAVTVINEIEFFVFQNASYSGGDSQLSTVHKILVIILNVFIGLPMMLYSMALVSLINVKALKLLSRSFLFWFKLMYFVQWFMCQEILDHANYSQYFTSGTYFVSEIIAAINIVMIILLVSSMDGLYLNIWSKRAILVSVSLNFIVGFLNYWIYGHHYYPITSVTVAGYEMNVLERMKSADQTLVIFLVKQTLSFWREPSKSTVIGKPTFIRWTS